MYRTLSHFEAAAALQSYIDRSAWDRCVAFAREVYGPRAATLIIFSAMECGDDGRFYPYIFDVLAHDASGLQLVPDWHTTFWTAHRRTGRLPAELGTPESDGAVGELVAERWDLLPPGDGRTVIDLRVPPPIPSPVLLVAVDGWGDQQ